MVATPCSQHRAHFPEGSMGAEIETEIVTRHKKTKISKGQTVAFHDARPDITSYLGTRHVDKGT